MAHDGRYSEWIDSLLIEELPPRRWSKLRAHLTGCVSCRDRYNRVSLAERMLHGGPAALDRPSPTSLARIGASLFEGHERVGLHRVPRWVFGILAAGVAALVILPLSLKPRRLADQAEFAVRGAVTDPAQQAGVRAFCLRGDAVTPLEPGSNRCGADELLKLTYSNRAGYEELFLVGLDESLGVKWYEPHPPSGMSVPAQRAVDQPVGGAIKLGVNHDPGLVRVYALFAHAPIAAREVEAAAGDLKARRSSIRDAASLPLADRADVVQRSVLIDITAGHKE